MPVLPVIQAKTAEKIILCAAPFVKVLKADTLCKEELTAVQFGSFWYKVEGFNPEKSLKMLAKKATEQTEVRFVITKNVYRTKK